MKKNWASIRYYHKNGYPISLCQLKPEELYLLEKQARYEFYGRFEYFFRNVLSFKSPLKITIIKGGASFVFFLKKCFLALTGKRVYSKILELSQTQSDAIPEISTASPLS